MFDKILCTAVAVLFMAVIFPITAVAGQTECPKQLSRQACEVWLRQQSAPALRGAKRASEPVRCVAVLSDQPSALVLRQGKGNSGPAVTSWRKATLRWKQTSRGFETTVCFPKRYVSAYSALTLCGAVGHSSWGNAEMRFLKTRNVGRNDPACTGGRHWCGARGL